MASSNELNEIFASLSRNKLRTILTSFGVFWGIFMLILLLATGDGLEKGVINRFNGYALNSFHLYPKKTEYPYNGFQERREVVFTDKDFETIKNIFSNEISKISMRSFLNYPVTVNKGETYNEYTLYGSNSDLIYIRNVAIIEGRFINERDLEFNRNFVVIGNKIQEELFEDESPIKKAIKINDSFYTVIGVFKSLKEGELAERENEFIFMPHTTFQKNFNRINRIDNISIMPKDNVKLDKKILSFLKKRLDIHPNDRKAIYIWSTEKEVSSFNGLFNSINLFIWIVGIGTLLSGVIGISNIMVISIKERKKEIGIRKAIGAKPISIIRMIVLESLIITSFAGYIGMSIGLMLVDIIDFSLSYYHLENEFFQNPRISLLTIGLSIIILIISGFFASYLPAKRAALIKPIEALRD